MAHARRHLLDAVLGQGEPVDERNNRVRDGRQRQGERNDEPQRNPHAVLLLVR